MIYGAQLKHSKLNFTRNKAVKRLKKWISANSVTFLLLTLVNVKKSVIISVIMALLPVWLSMINWDLQHSCSQIELKSLENWCLSVTPYLENKDGWDYKIYNSVLSCLGRTDVKVCRQSLEKDLIAFKAELEESDVILKVKPFDNDFYNYSNLSKLVLKYNILVSKLLSLINKENKREQINDFVLLQSSKLQTKFLESTSLLVYSILNLKKEKGSTSAGIDNIYFKSFEIEKQREIYNRLKNTKFQLSNKKFKIKQLKEIFLNIAAQPMLEQREILNTTFENWRGELEQIDDVTILGLKI